jgi:hypothetical protein
MLIGLGGGIPHPMTHDCRVLPRPPDVALPLKIDPMHMSEESETCIYTYLASSKLFDGALTRPDNQITMSNKTSN